MENEKEEVKDVKATEWSNRYKSYGSEDSKAVGLEAKAASEILTYGVSVKNVKFVKGLDWFILVDMLIISVILMANVYKIDENLIKTGRMIAIFGTLWCVVDVVATALKIYGEYVINIAPAVHIFMNSASAGNAYRKGYTKELIRLTPEEAENKIKQLKRKLRFAISEKIVVLLCIFCLGGCYLGGYLLFIETPNPASKAGLFALIGIGLGLLFTAIQQLINLIRK